MTKDTVIDNKILTEIQSNTEKLHKRLDMQNAMIESLLCREDTIKLTASSDAGKHGEKERQLINAIKDTIETLEQTKKSFKSKRLELLRKKLTNILID